MAVQASYSLKEESTRKRETDALLKIAETQAVETLLVITYDEEETIQKNGMEIKVIPIWKWLLDT